jgi:hypothetical protein
MVLTVCFALSPATGLVCHRHPQETCKKFASQELDASVGASGPHGLKYTESEPAEINKSLQTQGL